jgi:hypothetical protein
MPDGTPVGDARPGAPDPDCICEVPGLPTYPAEAHWHRCPVASRFGVLATQSMPRWRRNAR